MSVFRQDSSTFEVRHSTGGSIIAESLNNLKLPDNTLKIMLASCATSTTKQYDSALHKWSKFCEINKLPVWTVNINNYLLFLTEMYEKNLGYASINTARSALSSAFGRVDGVPIGEHPHIVKFMKGVSKLRPPAPRYQTTWDVNKVLLYLESLQSESIELRQLSLKLAALMTICSGQRVQTISSIKISNIVWGESIQIKITNILKTSSIRRSNPLIILPPYHNKQICPVKTLTIYMSKTKELRGDTDHLFISFNSPYKAVCSQTISRWLCEVLKLSGIEGEKYKAHSFRHASTSKAEAIGVYMDTIMSRIGWSQKSNTFARFYKRPVEDSAEYAISVLDK